LENNEFNLEGYDVVARAQFFEGGGPEGEVVLVSNNWGMYFLVSRVVGANEGTLRQTWECPGDPDDSDEALEMTYTDALETMIRYALSH
jgi:hypothetical protein